ncbi:MAG: hypothetical protein ACTHKY_03995 [Ginsengibacter sp.]
MKKMTVRFYMDWRGMVFQRQLVFRRDGYWTRPEWPQVGARGLEKKPY